MADSEPVRPDPDALAELAAREGRGRLKVFLGAAPGVGKTVEMLTEGKRVLAAGRDVLVGLVETHGRAETEAAIAPLPRIPLRAIAYRGQVLQEFDLDAALDRRPRILLLDELAHTNAPGSRHPKRWQDVEELRDAGIEVWTTMNVQHLESSAEAVARVTGVRVAETVPDSVLAGADAVELVDIPPAELLERMRAGKIYRPEQAERAMRGFFKEVRSPRCASWRCAAPPTAWTPTSRDGCAAMPWPGPGRWATACWRWCRAMAPPMRCCTRPSASPWPCARRCWRCMSSSPACPAIPAPASRWHSSSARRRR